MYEVSPFWHGALRLGGAIRWVEAARLAGSAAELERRGPDGLMLHGARSKTIATWRRLPGLRSRGRPLLVGTADWPARLCVLPLPPGALLVEGEPERLGERSVAVVGTRRSTAHGDAVARHLGSALTGAGLTVISGLARGIDGAAHRGAIGRTVAVFGHGLGTTAPPAHRGLRAALLERGGAAVSLWPDDVMPDPWRFPARNAVVAALAEVVIVVEAPKRSGALITARLAGECGREVAVVAPKAGEDWSEGCAKLRDEGASVIQDPDAFVATLSGGPRASRQVWEVALFQGARIEEAAQVAGIDVRALSRLLAMAEMDGRIVRMAGGRWAPA